MTYLRFLINPHDLMIRLPSMMEMNVVVGALFLVNLHVDISVLLVNPVAAFVFLLISTIIYLILLLMVDVVRVGNIVVVLPQNLPSSLLP